MTITVSARDSALGALYGLAIGDALGMPTQMMSREAIASRYGTLRSFEPADADHPLAAGMAAGSITDDTEQALLLARLLIEVMDADVAVEHGPERSVNKVPRRLADTTNARERLGFEAETNLEEGLRLLVEWWRAERARGTSPTLTGAS